MAAKTKSNQKLTPAEGLKVYPAGHSFTDQSNCNRIFCDVIGLHYFLSAPWTFALFLADDSMGMHFTQKIKIEPVRTGGEEVEATLRVSLGGGQLRMSWEVRRTPDWWKFSLSNPPDVIRHEGKIEGTDAGDARKAIAAAILEVQAEAFIPKPPRQVAGRTNAAGVKTQEDFANGH